METRRFTKARVLEVLDMCADHIAAVQRFDKSNGLAQITPRNASEPECSLIARAIEYGHMRAYEQMARIIREGFKFEVDDGKKPA